MRTLPPFADGAIFGLLFVPLLFFLKIICPLSEGCFVDPFFVPIFSPVFLLQFLAGKLGVDISLRAEMVFLILFWAVAWALLAHVGNKVFSHIPKEDEQ